MPISRQFYSYSKGKYIGLIDKINLLISNMHLQQN